MKVVIIGGGVIGLCSAFYLQKKGFEVTVLEKNNFTAGCSYGNMGYVSPSHFVPLATPGIIAQGLRWMMSSSSPFYLKPSFNIDLINWGLTFWKKSTSSNVKAAAPHLNNLLQLSRSLMVDLKSELPDSYNLIEKGVWMLYKEESTGEHEKQLAKQANQFGLKTVICNQAEVQAYEKQVEINAKGGVLYIDDCHLNPAVFMKNLHQNLVQKGVKLLEKTEVLGFTKENNTITKIQTNNGQLDCDELIIANGSKMQQISKLLEINLLMQPGKGYSMVYDGLEKNLMYPSILVDDRVATTPINKWLRFGGTMELSGHNDQIMPKRVKAIYDSFKKYYPNMDLETPDMNKIWYGYRPVTPDGIPYIGRHHQYKNLTYAGGHAMLGISAAAGTGQIVSEIINQEKPSIAIEAFSPQRK